MRALLLILPLVATPLASRAQEAADPGPVVEEVVLVVGDRVVTRTELELEARVVLVDNGGHEAAFASLTPDTLVSVQDYLINQMLIVGEAERLEVFDATPEEVDREVQRFASRFPDQATYEAFLADQDVSPERIAGIFRRDLRVRRYLESRVKLTVRIRDEEVSAFYAKNGERFAGRTLGEVGEVIRGFLFKQRYEETVRRLISDLRGRSQVRLLVPPEQLAPVAWPRRGELPR